MTKIPVSNIMPNPQQPRSYFDQNALLELAASIRENGLQTPILVEDNGDGFYTLVAGERRWRAHYILGLTEIEANVRTPTNHGGKQRLLDAVIENVQRESMTPVEEGRSYRKMRDEYGMSLAEIARTVGRPYNTISNRLKITELEPEIQDLIATKALPGSDDSVDALLSVPSAEGVRVKLAQALGTKIPTIKMVVQACAKVSAALNAPRPSGKYAKLPAMQVGATKAKVNPDDLEEQWDVLYQVNRVPPWPVYVESIQATCQSCSLYPMANDVVCRDCPLVSSVRRILEAVHGRR